MLFRDGLDPGNTFLLLFLVCALTWGVFEIAHWGLDKLNDRWNAKKIRGQR